MSKLKPLNLLLKVAVMAILCAHGVVTQGQEELGTDINKELNFVLKNIEKMQDTIQEKMKEHAREKYFSQGIGKRIHDLCPAIVDHVPNILQDEEVLKGLSSLTKDRNVLLRFLIFNVVIIIASWLWKLQYRMKPLLSFAYWAHALSRFVIINGARVALIIYYFGDALSPFGKYMTCT